MLRASDNLYDASLAPIKAHFGLKTELVTVFSFTTDLSEGKTIAIFVISAPNIPTVNFRSIKDVF